MSFVKKRKADSLLKAAKKRIKEQIADETEGEDRNSQKNESSEHRTVTTAQEGDTNCSVRIVENKRNHHIPDYINLSPSQFMSWWITSTGAKVKASNILLKYLKYKFDLDIATDYRTLLKTPVTPVPKYKQLGGYVHLGARSALKQLMTEAGPTSRSKVFMQFFVDGLKISKSTKDEFWIIMMNVRKVTKRRLTPKVVYFLSVLIY